MSISLPRHRSLTAALFVAFAIAACSGGSNAGSGGGSSPSVSPNPTATPSPVTTWEQALAAVMAVEPRLTGIRPQDPDVIGQSSWVEVVPAPDGDGFVVNARVGWGDCPAGCISEHTWAYAVAPDGTVTLESEAGEPVPADAWPAPGGDGRTGLMIVAVAGPVCPVETDPPRPECAPRPVADALIVIRDVTGVEVQAVMLDALGTSFVELPAGTYTLEPEPVEGLLGTPGAASATVIDGVGTPVELMYDTGIR
jgi:hypothetical protein